MVYLTRDGLDSVSEPLSFTAEDTSPLNAPALFLDSPLLSEDTSEDITEIETQTTFQPDRNTGTFDPQILFSKLDINTPFVKSEGSPQYGTENTFFIGSTASPPSPQTSLFNFTFPGQEQRHNPLVTSSSSPLSPSTATFSNEIAAIVIQPERYQVVNYNIHPATEIEFHQQFTEPVTIQATLLYLLNRTYCLYSFDMRDLLRSEKDLPTVTYRCLKWDPLKCHSQLFI